MRSGRVVVCILVALALSGCTGSSSSSPSPFKRDVAAAQVPSLVEAPRLDRQASPGEWDDALLLRGVFSIQDGTAASGDYPFEVRLGHDERNLFAYVAVHDVPDPNPFNGQPEPSSKYGFALRMFLDTKLGDGLESPADFKFFTNLREHGSHTRDGYWTGTDWVLQNEGGDPENKPWVDSRPGSGTWGRGWHQGTDLFWEIYVPLKPPSPEHDGFDPASSNGVFRMGLMFEVQGGKSPESLRPESPHDFFPGDGYTPNDHHDPATWMRLQLA